MKLLGTFQFSTLLATISITSWQAKWKLILQQKLWVKNRTMLNQDINRAWN